MKTNTKKAIFRHANLNDATNVVNLMNAYSQRYLQVNDFTIDELVADWTAPGFDLDEVARVVEDSTGRIIGYMDVMDMTHPHVKKFIWAILHPDAWDADLYREMLAWLKVICVRRINLAPKGARVYMSTATTERDAGRKATLEGEGFNLVRHFYHMVIELNGLVEPPTLPANLTIQPIQLETELKPALIAMDEAFEDHWGYIKRPIDELLTQWEHRLASDSTTDPALWFLVKDGNEIVANCYCNPQFADDKEMGWINQLSVRRPWRRQGVAMALLQTAFNAFYRRGLKRAGLGVDANSLTGATRLYEKAGMSVKYRFDSYEYELRPGDDLSK